MWNGSIIPMKRTRDGAGGLGCEKRRQVTPLEKFLHQLLFFPVILLKYS